MDCGADDKNLSESNDDCSEFSIKAQPFLDILSVIRHSDGTTFITLPKIIGVMFPHICDS